jgi:peroxiredoxin
MTRIRRSHRLSLAVGLSLVFGHYPLVIAQPLHPELGENYSAPAGVGRELIGTAAPEWALTDWMGGEPRTLKSLRGRVVLVRWWTAPHCPYCAASADGLNGLARKYGDRGLSVIGIYHHKEKSPLTREHVAAQAKRLGFTFPVAIDRDWKSLHAWWLDRVEAGWTSVTFVVDREGIIRHVHPGGAFFAGEPGYAALETAVEAALSM